MTEALQDYERPAGRPVFITVLCILTFIGSGWGLIGGAIQYFTAEKQAQTMVLTKEKASADLQKGGKDDAGTKMAEKVVNSMTSAFTVENLKNAALAAILAAALCLAGARMMWNLKKTGFYLYVVGTLVGIISPFLIYGSNNIMSIISSVIVGFIGIIFVILYGVNLKYMK
ncbi:MAG: hypothetical protein ABIN01_14540 [Ferruginibacter sp.]